MLRLAKLARPHPDTHASHAPPPTHTHTQVVYSYGFNQDASCVAVGSSKGYAIYNCEVRRACMPACVWRSPRRGDAGRSIDAPTHQSVLCHTRVYTRSPSASGCTSRRWAGWRSRRCSSAPASSRSWAQVG